MLRAVIGSTLFYIYLLIYTPIYSTLVVLLIPFFNVRRRYIIANYFNYQLICAVRLFCGLKWEIKGAENLPPPESGSIILANHESAWETHAVAGLMIPRQLCLVFKKEITYIPFFGWAMSALEMIPIDRSKGVEAFEQVRERGGQRLKEGAWMLFFPEGTRVHPREKKRYKTGGTRLAVATNVKVVPIAHNAADFWGKSKFLKKPGTITFSIGKPIYPDGHDADSMMQVVEDWIRADLRVISPNRPEPVAKPRTEKS
jgi:1-acyl-sn-glycerol-3-phosphate acyltransferase